MKLIVQITLVACIAVLSIPAAARVSQEQADRLGKDLTPLGGLKAGNEAGTIPAWDGGLTTPPPGYGGRENNARLIDPFPEDKPLYTITADNMAQYEAQLSEGLKAMFRQYPKTFKVPVYKSRRTVANPQWIYDATYQNALNAELGGNGEALVNAIKGIPFPIPQNGHEAVWNHKVRYRGMSGRRYNNQFAVTQSGAYNQVRLREDVMFPYSQPDATPESLDNIIIYFLQVITDPPRLAGTITLVHETMDQIAEPRRAWQYDPGQRRLRRAPNVGYDNPGNGADGLRTNDQTDAFNGAMDRYTWKLLGKKEMIVPYNAYRIHSDEVEYDDLIRQGHINQEFSRYELHRVWVVDSHNIEGKSHIYKRRTFYIDEDSWSILLIDIYDQRDQIWRVQEAHLLVGYDPEDPVLGVGAETVYDLQNGRYLLMAVNNEDEESSQIQWDEAYYKPGNVAKLVKR